MSVYPLRMRPHLRDLPIPALLDGLRAAGLTESFARQVAVRCHRGARTLDEAGVGREKRRRIEARFRFGPLLFFSDVRIAEDGTRKYLFRGGEDLFELVLIRSRGRTTACISSQAGCALGCTFCATARIGLHRNLTPGEITESILLAERDSSRRVTDVVFMGQGEPLHNYDAVVDACTNLHSDLGACLSRKKISISTVGLTPQIRRYTRERRPWRLYLSLHSAIQETRERLLPIAGRHPLRDLVEAMRAYQRECDVPWLTFQYVAIPDVNMDDAHIDALGRELGGLRYILNVIPYNETGAGYRPPSWAEVKDFTTRLRRLDCPVKTRYSAGKREGMGCGQLSAEAVATPATGGHLLAPPGIFTG